MSHVFLKSAVKVVGETAGEIARTRGEIEAWRAQIDVAHWAAPVASALQRLDPLLVSLESQLRELGAQVRAASGKADTVHALERIEAAVRELAPKPPAKKRAKR